MTTEPQAQTDAAPQTQPQKSNGFMRFAPLGALALAAGAAFYFFGDALSFDTLRDNREQLLAWRDANVVLVAGVFVAIYAAVVALSIPGAIWMTLLGGFLFGTWLGAPLIVLAATLGATAVFLIARTSLGAALREKAGPWLKKLEAGFQENAWSYMLILRLVPAFPFFVVNLAPALLGARLWTFVWTTALGIVPGTVVFTSVGAGLGEVIDQGGEPNLGVIFEPHVLGPLLGLAALSALPVLVKALRRRSGAAPLDATPAE
ncbi:MAG: TVP38/TMEM64 family protein [Pseudomonadota bacterium]